MELTEKIKKATLEELIIERYKRYEEEVGDGKVITQEALRIRRPDLFEVAKIRAYGGNREVKKCL